MSVERTLLTAGAESGGLVRASRWIGLLAALTMALAPAAAYLGIHLASTAAELEALVGATARAVGDHILARPEAWQLQERKLLFLIAPGPGVGAAPEDRVELRDAKGAITVEAGRPQPWPRIERASEVFDAGVGVATVVRSRSLRPVVVRSSPWVLLGLLLGSLAYFFLRVIPLRSAARSHAELARSIDALHEEKERAQVTLMSIGDAVVTTDVAGVVLTVNPVAAELLGVAGEAARGQPLSRIMCLVSEAARRPVANPVDECLRRDAVVMMANHTLLLRPDGAEFAIEDSAAPIRDRHGRTVGAVMVFHDVTEKKEAGKQLDLLAYTDAVTGLPNRNLFRNRLEASLGLSKREGKLAGLLFLDLDRFKIVNDTLGHGVGDALLRLVGERLRHCVRASDTVSRLGGDEFTVVLSGLAAPAGAEQVAKKIVDALVEPFRVGEHDLFVATSIGIVLYPTDGKDVDTLIKHADIAMYQAKQQGGSCFRFYDAATNQRSIERLQMEAELRHALERKEFSIHYQPKQRLADGAITGLEALLRWKSATLGDIGPAQFVPLLEASGLIVEVSQWLLGVVVRQLVAWHAAGLGPYQMSVNLSPRQFAQPHLAADILATIAACGLPAHCLELEITESMLIDEKLALRNLGTIKAGGITLALDDFGTGYSSLSYLRKYAFDVLKIDKSFVSDLDDGAGDTTLVAAIVAMARSLGIGTVAEGVETVRQREFLRNVGCDEIQGYFLARPMPAEACEAFLRAQQGQATADG